MGSIGKPKSLSARPLCRSDPSGLWECRAAGLATAMLGPSPVPHIEGLSRKVARRRAKSRARLSPLTAYQRDNACKGRPISKHGLTVGSLSGFVISGCRLKAEDCSCHPRPRL